MKVSKEFILEAHKEACSNWKNKIEKEFPELFVEEKLEVGKWYKIFSQEEYGFNYLWFISEIKNNKIFRYGFDEKGIYYKINNEYNELMSISQMKNFIPATKEEVETALIAEAKKRGLMDNEDIICAYHNKIKGNIIKHFYYDKKETTLWGEHGAVFYNGKWATIIEKPKFTKEEAEKQFNIKIV